MVKKIDKKPTSYVQKMGRQAGVAMHITSLPGHHGVGDIADSAMQFLDQLVEMDLGVWQILPSGPTAYGDSPYQPLSAFAGNPMFVGLNPLIQKNLLTSSEVAVLEGLPRDHVDYGQLIPAKTKLLITAAERFLENKTHGLATGFEEFQHQHGEDWLDDYAIFRVLKSMHGERPWPEWDKSFVHRKPAALKKLKNEYRARIEQIKVVQFLFDHQWKQLAKHAHEKGICLFGDMPIYIALDSSDAWAHPQRLLLNKEGKPSAVAGVPPDYFSEDGQLWGNPLYDWAYHKETGYRWWTERIQHAVGQTPLVRIDHFRGFESFWSVPYGSTTAREGKWEMGPGDSLFDAMQKAMGDLPIVAEDLGVITPEVDQLRNNHNLPGMVVLQFEVGNPDFDISAVEENSVCYTGTHDNDTTLGWFTGNGDDTRIQEEILNQRINTLKQTGGSAGTLVNDMIRLAFSSNSTLAVAPMQDYLGLGSSARFNTPGTTMNNWRWRVLPEQLQPGLLETVADLVESGQRCKAKKSVRKLLPAACQMTMDNPGKPVRKPGL
jgi:4-alpha-glucanotransferase